MQRMILVIIGWCLIGQSSLSAQDVGNKLTLKEQIRKQEQSISLEESFRFLENKFDVTLIYKSFLVEGEVVPRKVVEAKDFQTALTELTNIINLKYEQVGRRSFLLSSSAEIPSAAIAQETITGTVTDAQSGETLPGVNILVKGTSTGASTNADGQYELEVESLQDTLVVSFVGYKTQQVPINGRTEIDVALQKQAISGEEMVVVGYGEKKQSEMSSSIATVSEEEMQNITSKNIGDKLQGKVSGLVVSNTSGHPKEKPSIVIQGTGSIGAGNQPLYVVDGIIGGTYDPHNVKSATVLKDAAATSIYGSRAANGVIVITTKSGKPGKTKVSYNASGGFTYFRTGNLEVMNGKEFYENRKEAARNFYENQVESGNAKFTNQSFDQYLESVIPSSVLNRMTNWQSLLSRRGYINQQQLSVSGGNKSTTFYISGNYYHENGTLLDEQYQKINLRANLEHKISDRFDLTFRVNGGTEKFNNDPFGGQSSKVAQYYINVPWDAAYTEDGTPFQPFVDGFWYTNNGANYIYNRQYYSDRTKMLDLTTDLVLKADITNWMSFSTSNRLGLGGSDHKQLFNKKFKLAKADNGRLTQNYAYNTTYTTSNLLKINHNFGNHHISGTLGQEYTHSESPNTRSVGAGLPTGLSALSSTGRAKEVGGTNNKSGFLSYFTKLDYNYLGRYFLTGSVRRDGSSVFGENNRWGLFYAIGGSWMINEEDFLNSVSWIDMLKLRLSYGTTGNANIPNYLSLGTYAFSGQSTYNNTSGARPARLPNPNLTWEKAYNTNIGLDFSFLNRVKVNLDLYQRKNKSLLQGVPLPATSGFGSQQRNVGSIRNRGINVNISSENIQGKEFQWKTYYIMSVNKNKVLVLNKGNDIPNGRLRISEGRPLNSFYMKKWAGVDAQTGEPMWIRWEDKQGNIIQGGDHVKPYKVLKTHDYNKASNLFVGSSYPDFTGGLRNELSYKNFSLSVFLNFVSDQNIYNNLRRRISDDGAVLSKGQMKLPDGDSRWEKPSDHAEAPELILGGNNNSFEPSSRYIEDGSYVNIKNITLSYSFPPKYQSLFSKLQLYFKVDNVATFTDFSGTDPQVNIGNPVTDQNKSTARWGIPRKLILGINISI